MILLDAYALISFLVGGPAASEVGGIMRQGRSGVATANLVETFDVSQRVHGLAIERVVDTLEPLFETSVAVIPLDLLIARRAAEIRARHYHRVNRPISLADAVLLASARARDRVATADPDVLAVAQVEAIATMRLPDLN